MHETSIDLSVDLVVALFAACACMSPTATNSSTCILPVSTRCSVLLMNLQLQILPCPRRHPAHCSRNRCPVQALSTPTACQLDRHEWWPLKGYPGACIPLLRPTGLLILHMPSSDPLAIADHWPCISIPSPLHENPRNRKVHYRFKFALLSYHLIARLFLVCPHRLQLHLSIVSLSRSSWQCWQLRLKNPPEGPLRVIKG
jgi:hypothetical protein